MYLSVSPLLFTSCLSSAICKAFSENHFAFLLSFFFGMVLFTASCSIFQTSVHSSSGTLFTRSNPLNQLVTSMAYSQGIWFKFYLAGLVVFPVFFSLSLNFAMRSWWSEPQSAPVLFLLTVYSLFNLISVLTMWWSPCVKLSLVLLKKGICYDKCILLAEFS